jgi:hypothetical protein
MNNDNFGASSVLVGKVVAARAAWWFFPAREWRKSVSDVGAVLRRGVVPAVVASSVLVDREVIAAACWAKEFALFVAGLELVKKIKDGERHSAGMGSAPHHGSPEG